MKIRIKSNTQKRVTEVKYETISDCFLKVQGSTYYFLMFLTFLTGIANKNYYFLLIAQKALKIKLAFSIKDFFYGYNVDFKLS